MIYLRDLPEKLFWKNPSNPCKQRCRKEENIVDRDEGREERRGDQLVKKKRVGHAWNTPLLALYRLLGEWICKYPIHLLILTDPLRLRNSVFMNYLSGVINKFLVSGRETLFAVQANFFSNRCNWSRGLLERHKPGDQWIWWSNCLKRLWSTSSCLAFDYTSWVQAACVCRAWRDLFRLVVPPPTEIPWLWLSDPEYNHAFLSLLFFVLVIFSVWETNTCSYFIM